jgi:RimJ/RimL family protein N-acetyltransferase
MDMGNAFRSGRLTGRAPDAGAATLYRSLFGPDRGSARLAADMQDWARHAVGPWVLVHAGHPVGVAGFRIGFGGDGLELSFHFLPDVAGQWLASEFVQAALDHATSTLREDRFFAFVPVETPAPRRILEKAGFTETRVVRDEWLMELSLPRPGGGARSQRGG